MEYNVLMHFLCSAYICDKIEAILVKEKRVRNNISIVKDVTCSYYMSIMFWLIVYSKGSRKKKFLH